MSVDTLISLLRDYGFSEKEAKIYLTCLEFGEDVPSSIARRAGENRVTTYSILKDLNKRGMANEVTKNKKKYYSVLPPQKLVKKQEEKFIKLRESLPQLMAITNQYAHQAKVYFYEGFEGLKEVYEDMLNSEENLLAILGYQDINEKFKDYLFNEHIPQRIKAGVFAKVIAAKDNYTERYAKHDKEFYKETLVIDDNVFDMEAEIVVYGGNRLAILLYSGKELTGVIIESKSLHDSMRSLFNLVWRAYSKKPLEIENMKTKKIAKK